MYWTKALTARDTISNLPKKYSYAWEPLIPSPKLGHMRLSSFEPVNDKAKPVLSLRAEEPALARIKAHVAIQSDPTSLFVRYNYSSSYFGITQER